MRFSSPRDCRIRDAPSRSSDEIVSTRSCTSFTFGSFSSAVLLAAYTSIAARSKASDPAETVLAFVAFFNSSTAACRVLDSRSSASITSWGLCMESFYITKRPLMRPFCFCVRLLGDERAQWFWRHRSASSGGCTVGEKAPNLCLAPVLISPRDLTKSPYRFVTRCRNGSWRTLGRKVCALVRSFSLLRGRHRRAERVIVTGEMHVHHPLYGFLRPMVRKRFCFPLYFCGGSGAGALSPVRERSCVCLSSYGDFFVEQEYLS